MSGPRFPDRIVSVDVEANGLHGQCFAFASTVQDRREGEQYVCQMRVPIVGQVDQWVREHVLPIRSDLAIARRASQSAMETFREDYEIFGAETGTISVCYSGHCDKCGLTLAINEKREIPGWDET